MSWNFAAYGRPEAVKKELEIAINRYQPGTQSRLEFESARLALLAIIDANVGPNAGVEVTAYGSASIDGDGKVYAGNCKVLVEPKNFVG